MFRKKHNHGNYYSYSNRTSEYSQYRAQRWRENRHRHQSDSDSVETALPLHVTLALSALLLMPNLLAIFMAGDLTPFWQRIIYLLASLTFFFLPATVLKARTFFFVQSPLLLMGIVEIVHLFVDHATTSLLFVYTCLIAEPGEFTELMSNYLLLIILLLLVWAAWFVAVCKFAPRGSRIFFGNMRLMAGGILLVAAVVMLSITPLRHVVARTCPFDFYVAMGRIHNISGAINRGQAELDDFRFDVRTDDTSSDALMVLVIGETARYDHFGLNGYERPTTPLLSDRHHLVSFDSIYGVANLTTVSVPLMLSRATPQRPQPLAHERSLTDAMSEAGYHTAWIANQSRTNRILRPIAERCNTCNYMAVNDPAAQHDFGLLPLLAQQLKHDGRQFTLLHSLGCHFEYNKRYPPEFSIYQPDAGNDMMSNRELLVNSYDNSVIYTDRFLDSVISMLEQTQRPAVMVYISDHGENLLDDDRDMFLHGTYSGSLYEYHVPMFVWTSDAWRATHPDSEDLMVNNKHTRQSSMTLFHTLLQLADVSGGYDAAMSMASDQLRRADTLFILDANLNCVTMPRR